MGADNELVARVLRVLQKTADKQGNVTMLKAAENIAAEIGSLAAQPALSTNGDPSTAPTTQVHTDAITAHGDNEAALRAESRAFIAGWFAHARNPKDAPLLVEDAWHAYRLVESAALSASAEPEGGEGR